MWEQLHRTEMFVNPGQSSKRNPSSRVQCCTHSPAHKHAGFQNENYPLESSGRSAKFLKPARIILGSFHLRYNRQRVATIDLPEVCIQPKRYVAMQLVWIWSACCDLPGP